MEMRILQLNYKREKYLGLRLKVVHYCDTISKFGGTLFYWMEW